MRFFVNLSLIVHCFSTALTMVLTKLSCSHPPSMAERNYNATKKRFKTLFNHFLEILLQLNALMNSKE